MEQSICHRKCNHCLAKGMNLRAGRNKWSDTILPRLWHQSINFPRLCQLFFLNSSSSNWIFIPWQLDLLFFPWPSLLLGCLRGMGPCFGALWSALVKHKPAVCSSGASTLVISACSQRLAGRRQRSRVEDAQRCTWKSCSQTRTLERRQRMPSGFR